MNRGAVMTKSQFNLPETLELSDVTCYKRYSF